MEMMIKMYQTTLEHFEKKLQSQFPEDNLTVIEFSKTNSPVVIRCNKCGHIYSYKRGTTLYESKRKYFCKLCNTESVKRMQQACENHNLAIIAYGDKVTDVFTLQCNNCGLIFKRTPATWLKYDCPNCGMNKKIIDKQIYQDQLDKQFGKNEVIILDDIPKSHSMTIQHKCGFIRTSSFKAIIQGKACPFCDKTASLGERKILLFLEKNKINYSYQKAIPNTRLHFDFFLEEQNIAIEFNGVQHYQPIDFFGGEERFQQQQKYDQAKIKYCQDNNIKLLTIHYSDIDNIEQILAAELQGGLDE